MPWAYTTPCGLIDQWAYIPGGLYSQGLITKVNRNR